MIRVPLLLCCFLYGITAMCQDSTLLLRINFQYGSKPAKGYKQTESKRFGGIKGGHVNIELEGRVLDFAPGGRCHLFSRNKKPGGGFSINSRIWWDTLTEKSAYIVVPITRLQADSLHKIFDRFAAATPYDYAVFGHRCASATYHVLSRVGILRRKSTFGNVAGNFYPKLLRKKLFKWAAKQGYFVKKFEGSVRRKWESDAGIF
jgi:hypothetical protein